MNIFFFFFLISDYLMNIYKSSLPLRMAKLSGFRDLSFASSLLAVESSIQFFASEMQALRSQEGKSKEAASAHKLSCIIFILLRQLISSNTCCKLLTPHEYQQKFCFQEPIRF
jgi:hypothetical protein